MAKKRRRHGNTSTWANMNGGHTKKYARELLQLAKDYDRSA